MKRSSPRDGSESGGRVTPAPSPPARVATAGQGAPGSPGTDVQREGAPQDLETGTGSFPPASALGAPG